MTLDAKYKFQLVDNIVKYIDENFTRDKGGEYETYDEYRIQVLLGKFGIIYNHSYCMDIYLTQGDGKIVGLAEYLLNDQGISRLFYDKYAVEVLQGDDKFFNLNLYINECFECIKMGRKIATALLLRSCAETSFIYMDSLKGALRAQLRVLFKT